MEPILYQKDAVDYGIHGSGEEIKPVTRRRQ